MKDLERCNVCPRHCNVNRTNNELGFCQSNDQIKIANYSLHMWEEPCISNTNGSGTIFFSYCNLRCIYCQNYQISRLHKGKIITKEELIDIMLHLQKLKAHNINLVTPTHYSTILKEVIPIAKEKGLHIPIIYNTSSYEEVDSLKKLNGLIDVYLPDLKYYSDTLAKKYSNCDDYFNIATKAIDEMYKQVGKVEIENNLIKKGVIVRHLVLPGHTTEAKRIIKYLYDTYQDNIFISIMNQYTPVNKTKYPNLNRSLTAKEYDSVIDYAYSIGVRNAFVQEGNTVDTSFIPVFSDYIK